MDSTIRFGRSVDSSFADAIARVTEELGKEGFGVLTEIDVAATLKKKLGVDRPAYRILGACNPEFADQALQMAPEIGVLLPCNVIVRDDQGTVRVEFMNPESVLGLIDQPDVVALATEVKRRLEKVCAAL